MKERMAQWLSMQGKAWEVPGFKARRVHMVVLLQPRISARRRYKYFERKCDTKEARGQVERRC